MVINEAVLRDLENRLGRKRMRLFAAVFREQLAKVAKVMQANANDRGVLARETDTLILLAANMGLGELILLCRNLSTSLRADADAREIQDRLAVLSAAVDRASSAIEDRYPLGDPGPQVAARQSG